MSRCLRITGGKVYDPANGVDGLVRDVLAVDGVIVDALPPGAAPRVIKVDGMIVMPGGVDMHCHIASGPVNQVRAAHCCAHAGGTVDQLCPSTFDTGYGYAALGYTTAIDSAVSPTGARHAHLELDDTPNIDAGFLLLLANHQHLIELLDAGDKQAAAAFVAHLLRKTGAFGIKAVNPGGVATWRADATRSMIESIDDTIAGTSVTPRLLLEVLADAADALQLPHAVHVHGNRLGLPGNVATTLETLAAFDGRRVHLAHLQFHAYGKTSRGRHASAADRLAAYFNDHANVTADVGQIIFGDAVTITADTPLGYLLAQLTGNSQHTLESELETGCTIMPHSYKPSNYTTSLQWAIGLELLLMAADPWRMLLSTDHPNGGSFRAYPAVIAALMSKAVRDEMAAAANAKAIADTHLPDLDRELTLADIATITRAGPARALGLIHKGQLGPGADADVTIYNDDTADPQRMFESPRYVIKAGHVLVDDGELRKQTPGIRGSRLRADIEPTDQGEKITSNWFARHGSYDVTQLGLHEHELQGMRVCRRT